MLPLLKSWVELPTPSTDIHALDVMQQTIIEAFLPLNPEVQKIPVSPWKKLTLEGKLEEIPLAPLLLLKKETGAQKRILLGGHIDTAVPNWRGEIRQNRFYGPGTCDMKGGLVVLLDGLKRFEKSPNRHKLDWEIMINSDEEIGSIGSSRHFANVAKRHNTALLFEPTLKDGGFAIARKGSMNLTALSRGEQGHAGRDFFHKQDAIYPLCQFVVEAQKLIDKESQVSVNIGIIQGGIAHNVISDTALCRINVRSWENLNAVKQALYQIASTCGVELYQESFRPEKPLNQKTKELFNILKEIAGKTPMKGEKTGGVCDGNNLSALGLATLDTMGVRGGGLHTTEEYVDIDSLEEKSDLFYQFLMHFSHLTHKN